MDYLIYFVCVFMVSFCVIYYFFSYTTRKAQEETERKETINQLVHTTIIRDYNLWENRYISHMTFGAFMVNRYKCNDTVVMSRDSAGRPTRVVNVSDMKDPMDTLYVIRQSIKFHRVISAYVESVKAKNGR